MSEFDMLIILIALVILVVFVIIVDLMLVCPEKSEPRSIPRFPPPHPAAHIPIIAPCAHNCPETIPGSRVGHGHHHQLTGLEPRHLLRELVLNAANACNKERFLSISSTNTRLSMKIRSNRDRRAVRIKDSGVGMTRLELMNNLSRIMQSRTRKFVEALGEGGGGHRRCQPCQEFGVIQGVQAY